jgi:hypothetical protein
MVAFMVFSVICFSQNWNHALVSSSNNQSEGDHIVGLADSSFISVGDFTDFITFNTRIVSPCQGRGFFVVHHDLQNNIRWTKSICYTGLARALNIAADEQYVYIAGYFSDQLILPDTTISTQRSKVGFVIQYTLTGQYVNAYVPDCDNCQVKGICADNGQVFITGDFVDDFVVEGITYNETGGNMYLIGLNTQLEEEWWQCSQGSSTYGENIAVNGGYLGVVGGYGGGAIIANYTLNNINTNHNMYVALYETDGSGLWAKGITGDGEVHGYGVDINDQNQVFGTGEFENNALLPNNDTIVSTGHYDVVTIAFDISGNQLWCKTIGGIGEDVGYDLNVDQNGDPVVLAMIEDSIYNDEIGINAQAFTEPVLMKFDKNNGSFINNLGVHGRYTYGRVESISFDLNNGVYSLVGNMRDSLVLPWIGYEAQNNKDAFVISGFDTLTYFLSTNENELSDKINWSIYPNPTNSYLNIEGDIPDKINVWSTSGKLFFTYENVSSIDLTSLVSGIYFVEIQKDKNREVISLVKL